MIPKIIHYTWFSNDPMPDKVLRCMASWQQIMPDYELKKWDMEAIKHIDVPFLKEALAAKKWAYAADFVRMYAVFYEGGIYLDTDVQVYKSFDRFLNDKCFIGRESSIHFFNEGPMLTLSSHCFGAEKEHPFMKKCLDYYLQRHFVTSCDQSLPESLRYNIVLAPYIQAEIAAELFGYDWKPSRQDTQHLKDGLVIYPSNIFDPFQGHSVNRSMSYCLHLAMGGWRDKSHQLKPLNLFNRIVFRLAGVLLKRLHCVVLRYN